MVRPHFEGGLPMPTHGSRGWTKLRRATDLPLKPGYLKECEFPSCLLRRADYGKIRDGLAPDGVKSTGTLTQLPDHSFFSRFADFRVFSSSPSDLFSIASSKCLSACFFFPSAFKIMAAWRRYTAFGEPAMASWA